MLYTLTRFYKKIPRRLVTTVFLIALSVFLILYLKGTDFSRLRHLHINWWLIAAGSVTALVFRYWMVVIWRTILRALGSRDLPSFRTMAYVYAKAWITRYVPGTVTWIAGKVYMASGFGISKSRLAVSSVLEGGMQVVATTVVSLFILSFSPHLSKIPLIARLLIMLISLAALTVLYPPIFNRMLIAAHVALKKQRPGVELRINGRAVVRSFLLFSVGTFISGTASYLIVLAIAPQASLSWYFYVVGAFGISGAIGIATPFLPSGIGVRDGVLLVLLTAIMPKELALAVTVFTRIWQVAADAAFLGIAAFVYRLGPDERYGQPNLKT
jgi:uncharacterized membrane protein YbhN (UPF0104 family)